MYIKTEYCCSYAYQHWIRPDTRMVFRADINTPITAHHLISYALDPNNSQPDGRDTDFCFLSGYAGVVVSQYSVGSSAEHDV